MTHAYAQAPLRVTHPLAPTEKRLQFWSLFVADLDFLFYSLKYTDDHPQKPVGGRRIIHVSYRLEGGKSVTDIGYYSQIADSRKIGTSLPLPASIFFGDEVRYQPPDQPDKK